MVRTDGKYEGRCESYTVSNRRCKRGAILEGERNEHIVKACARHGKNFGKNFRLEVRKAKQ